MSPPAPMKGAMMDEKGKENDGGSSPKPWWQRLIPVIVTVAVLVGVGLLLGWLAFHADEEGPQANFPPDGPAEFLYLDGTRVAAYLAQINGGDFASEKRTDKLTEALNGKLAVPSVGEAGGSRTQESTIERQIAATDASSFFALHAGLRQQEQLDEIGLRYFEDEVKPLQQGQFVTFKTTALLPPVYLNPYLAVKQANTLKAIFPNLNVRRRAARSFYEEVGSEPRVVFALRPPDPARTDAEARAPFVYLLPLNTADLTEERSLIKYGGGQFTVVGKLVRQFPEPGRDDSPAYVDSPTRETWLEPLKRAPGELLCRTDPECVVLVRRSSLSTEERRRAIAESRKRMIEALKAQTAIDENGAVILPVAIYK